MTKTTQILLISLLFTNIISDNYKKKIFISQAVQHPALNKTVKGIIDILKTNGFLSGKNIDIRIESAQANVALASQIASKFVSQNPDVLVGVGTISAQSFIKFAAKNRVNLIFSSITDPIGASLVKDIQQTTNYITGISNFVSIEPQIGLFKKLQPKLTRLGIIYNSGEINSVSIVKQLSKICAKLDIVLVKQIAYKTADIPQSATKLAAQVDAIFISNDNTALCALQSIINAANKAKIPVYVSDTDAVALGALAALGPNQYDVGIQTGKMIIRSINGEYIKDIPIEFPNKTELYINLNAANIVGIKIPKDIIVKANKIINKSPK